MPENWPPNNVPQTPEKTPTKTADTKKVEMRNEILKLKTEIVEEEERISMIPKEINRQIAQNLLEEKRGRLEMRVNEYAKL